MPSNHPIPNNLLMFVALTASGYPTLRYPTHPSDVSKLIIHRMLESVLKTSKLIRWHQHDGFRSSSHASKKTFPSLGKILVVVIHALELLSCEALPIPFSSLSVPQNVANWSSPSSLLPVSEQSFLCVQESFDLSNITVHSGHRVCR